MKRIRRSVKIQDVARAAGVSVSTVSRVLNNKDDVAEETFDRVRVVIDELGYTSSLAARGMRSHRTNVIGVIMPGIDSTYCQAIMRGLNKAIVQMEYDLIIYTNGRPWWHANGEMEVRNVALLNGSIADGMIAVTPTATDLHTHYPLVIIDPNNEAPGVLSVISTNREGALDAMRYLIGLGHRRIAHITGRTHLLSGMQRLKGYLDGLALAEISYDESLVAEGDYSVESAVNAARRLLSLPNPPTAIFAGNDMSAMGVYEVAREMGIRIPDQLSVVGFDNLPEAIYSSPSLTTIDQNVETMGFIATEMLVKLIRGESPDMNPCVMPTSLVVRESCRCVG